MLYWWYKQPCHWGITKPTYYIDHESQGKKTSGCDQELAQTQPTDSTVRNLYNQHTMLLKNFKINNKCMPFFDIWNKLFKLFWIYFAWHLSSTFSSRRHIVWKMSFEEFYDGCLMLSPLWHFNGMVFAFLCNLAVCCLQSSFLSRGYMVWKMMMVE